MVAFVVAHVKNPAINLIRWQVPNEGKNVGNVITRQAGHIHVTCDIDIPQRITISWCRP